MRSLSGTAGARITKIGAENRETWEVETMTIHLASPLWEAVSGGIRLRGIGHFEGTIRTGYLTKGLTRLGSYLKSTSPSR